MLSRVSILSFVATLFLLLFGESGVEGLNAQSNSLQEQHIELEIVDADIPNPTSLLSGRESSRTVNSSSRTVQRTACKRTCSVNIAVKAESESLVTEHSYKTYKPNILGGVVAERAFYSLCCLRI